MMQSGRMDLKKANIHKSVTFISNNVFMTWKSSGDWTSWKDMAWVPGTSVSSTGIVIKFRWWIVLGVTMDKPYADREESHRGIYCRPRQPSEYISFTGTSGTPWSSWRMKTYPTHYYIVVIFWYHDSLLIENIPPPPIAPRVQSGNGVG